MNLKLTILQLQKIFWKNFSIITKASMEIKFSTLLRKSKKTDAYFEADPIAIVDAAKLFTVKPNETYLFWPLRVYVAMPLPEYWVQEFDKASESYICRNLQSNMRLSVHPCYSWIKELIQFLRSKLNEHLDEFLLTSSKMVFRDQLQRTYEVDVGAMMVGEKERDRPHPLASYFSTSDAKLKSKDDLLRKKQGINPNLRDAHIVELAHQAGVDVNTEIHLLMVIEDFVKAREQEEKWVFRPLGNGGCFWVNHEHKKAVKEYPHLEDLKKEIKNFKKQYDVAELKKHRKDNSLIKAIFRKHTEETALKLLMQEAKNFVEYFLANKELIEANSSSVSGDKRIYSMRKLTKLIGSEMSKQDLFEILFYCPFNLEFGLGEIGFASKNNLLKKIKVNNHNKKGNQDDDEEDDDIATSTFNEASLNINNPKMLLSIAESFKPGSKLAGLKGDLSKKKEFLKLIFDWEKKYGNNEYERLEKIEAKDPGNKTNRSAKDKKQKGLPGKPLEQIQAKSSGEKNLIGQERSQSNTKILGVPIETKNGQQKPLSPTIDNRGFPLGIKADSSHSSRSKNTLQKGDQNALNENKRSLLNLNSSNSTARQQQRTPSQILDTKRTNKSVKSNLAIRNEGNNRGEVQGEVQDVGQDQDEGQGEGEGESEGKSQDEIDIENVENLSISEGLDHSGRSSIDSLESPKLRNSQKKKTTKGKTFLAKDVKENPNKNREKESKPREAADVIQEDQIVLESREVSEYEEVEQPDGKVDLVRKVVRKKIPVLRKKEKKTKKIKTKKIIIVKEIDASGKEVEKMKEVEEEIEVTDDEDQKKEEEGKKKRGPKKKTRKIYEEVDIYTEVEEIDGAGKTIKRLKKITRRIVKEVPWDYVDEDVAKQIRNKIDKQLRKIDPSKNVISESQSHSDSNQTTNTKKLMLNSNLGSKRGYDKDSPEKIKRAKIKEFLERLNGDSGNEEKSGTEDEERNEIRKKRSGSRVSYQAKPFDTLKKANIKEIDRQIKAAEEEELQDQALESASNPATPGFSSNRKKAKIHAKQSPNVEELLQARSLSPASRRQSPALIHRKLTQPTKVQIGISEDHNFEENLHFAMSKLNPSLPFKRVKPFFEKKDAKPIDLQDNFAQNEPNSKAGVFIFTECQPNNRKTREFMDQIKMKLFHKQLDEIIIDFLFHQYNQLNLERGEASYDVNDQAFKLKFIRKNRKLINFLREKLCKSKHFYRSLYTNTFINTIAEEFQEQQQQSQQQFLTNAVTDNFKNQFMGFKEPINDFKAQSNGFNDQIKDKNLLIPNLNAGRSFKSARNRKFTPKKINIGSTDFQPEENNKMLENTPHPTREESANPGINSNSFPEETAEIQKPATPKATINRTGSVGNLALPKTNPLKKTLSTLNFKHGQNLALEFQTSTPIIGTRRSNSQYLIKASFQDSNLTMQTFSDKNIKPLNYPEMLNPNIKYRNPPRSVQNSPIISKRMQYPQDFSKPNVINIFEENTEQDKKNYSHYVSLIGEPTKVSYYAALSKASAPSSIHSYSLMLMASRLGLKITNEDSDLSWIPYLALSLQTPPEFQKKMNVANTEERILVHKLCALKPGTHPADKYFGKLIEHYLHFRSKILNVLNEDNKSKFIWSHSWMKFLQANGNFFFFNMYSKEKSDLLPLDAKALLQKFVAIQKKYGGLDNLKDYALQSINTEINQIVMKKQDSTQKIRENYTLTPLKRDEVIKIQPYKKVLAIQFKP